MHSHSTPEVAVLSTLILFCENAVLASRLVHEPTFKITTPRAHGLSQSSGFSLGFEQAQDVVNFDWSFDISDDASTRVVHEFDSDLCDTTSRTSSAEDSGDFDELDGDFAGIHLD